MLSAQNTRLQALEHGVQTGHATILARLDDTADPPRISAPLASHHAHGDARRATQSNTMVEHRTKRSAHKSRVSLPRWLINCTWEFGLQESEGGWDFQIHPVNLRPRTRFIFDVVRPGSVPAVRKLMDSKSFPYETIFHSETVGQQSRISISSRSVSKVFSVIADNY